MNNNHLSPAFGNSNTNKKTTQQAKDIMKNPYHMQQRPIILTAKTTSSKENTFQTHLKILVRQASCTPYTSLGDCSRLAIKSSSRLVPRKEALNPLTDKVPYTVRHLWQFAAKVPYMIFSPTLTGKCCSGGTKKKRAC